MGFRHFGTVTLIKANTSRGSLKAMGSTYGDPE